VAICPRSRAPGPKIDFSELVQKKLYTRSFVVAVSRHPKRLDARAVRRASHVIIASDGTGRALSTTCWRRSAAAARRRHRHVVSIAARLVADTDLVATLPEDVVRTSGLALTAHTPPFAIPRLPCCSSGTRGGRRTRAPVLASTLVHDAVRERATTW
jgi:hypothetical protein